MSDLSLDAAIDRAYGALRRLQAIMRGLIDPEGVMTDEQFKHAVLDELDADRLNEALEALHAQGFDAEMDEIDPEEPFEPDWDRLH